MTVSINDLLNKQDLIIKAVHKFLTIIPWCDWASAWLPAGGPHVSMVTVTKQHDCCILQTCVAIWSTVRELVVSKHRASVQDWFRVSAIKMPCAGITHITNYGQALQLVNKAAFHETTSEMVSFLYQWDQCRRNKTFKCNKKYYFKTAWFWQSEFKFKF